LFFLSFFVFIGADFPPFSILSIYLFLFFASVFLFFFFVQKTYHRLNPRINILCFTPFKCIRPFYFFACFYHKKRIARTRFAPYFIGLLRVYPRIDSLVFSGILSKKTDTILRCIFFVYSSIFLSIQFYGVSPQPTIAYPNLTHSLLLYTRTIYYLLCAGIYYASTIYYPPNLLLIYNYCNRLQKLNYCFYLLYYNNSMSRESPHPFTHQGLRDKPLPLLLSIYHPATLLTL